MNSREEILNLIVSKFLTGVPKNVSAQKIREVLSLMVDRQYFDHEIRVTANGINAIGLKAALEELLSASGTMTPELIRNALSSLSGVERLSFAALKDVPASTVDFAAFVSGVQTMSNSTVSAEPGRTILMECYPAAVETFSQVKWTVTNAPLDYTAVFNGLTVALNLSQSGTYTVNCQLLRQNATVVCGKSTVGFIEVQNVQSAAKDITAFIFEASRNAALDTDIVCTVNQSTGQITAELPQGTDLSNLTPTITHTGNAITPASLVAQNFNGTVSYQVTAQDGSMKDYDVSLTVAQAAGDVHYGYRTVDDGELLTTDPDFDNIATGIAEPDKHNVITGYGGGQLTVDWKDQFGISALYQSWHWLLVPASIGEYQSCNWDGNLLGVFVDIENIIRSGDPVQVTVNGTNYLLYRLPLQTSNNYQFDVTEV